jgi:hypothetical protein
MSGSAMSVLRPRNAASGRVAERLFELRKLVDDRQRACKIIIAKIFGQRDVGANMEPKSPGIAAEIQHENDRIDSKIGSICRGC